MLTRQLCQQKLSLFLQNNEFAEQLTKVNSLLKDVYKIAMEDWNDPKWHDQVLQKAREHLKEIKMTKEEKKNEMKNKISMALKDPILQQGFEIICKENAESKGQLVKAAEIIKRMLPLLPQGYNDMGNSDFIWETRNEAEKFLKEIKSE